MKFISPHFFILLVCFLALSCSKAKQDERKMEINLAALAGENFVGGSLLEVKNIDTGLVTVHELTTSPFKVIVDDGKWDFKFVGFIGPNAWVGAIHCGAVSNVELAPLTEEIHISELGNCTTGAYSALISTKSTRWDLASWDTGTFAP